MKSSSLQRVGGLVLLITATIALSGCGGRWYVRAGCEGGPSSDPTCKVEGGVDGKFIRERTSASDFSSLSVDVSGSTISFPTNGNATLILTGAEGTLASGAFAWIRNGDIIALADPSAANAWALPFADTATGLDFSFDDFQVPATSGQNTIAVSVNVNGSPQAGASQTWNSGCQYFCDER